MNFMLKEKKNVSYLFICKGRLQSEGFEIVGNWVGFGIGFKEGSLVSGEIVGLVRGLSEGPHKKLQTYNI